MGTRGAWGFHKDGETIATYNHFDSYPTGLGEEIKRFIQNNSIDKIDKIASELHPVQADETPTPEEAENLSGYRNENVNGGANEWYNLLREAQGNPQAYADDENLRAFIDSTEFLQDSLFCEWAYIINLDDGVLEIYRGFNKLPPKDSRYYNESTFKSNSNYYPVNGVAVVPFDVINEFSMSDFENKLNEEEDW